MSHFHAREMLEQWISLSEVASQAKGLHKRTYEAGMKPRKNQQQHLKKYRPHLSETLLTKKSVMAHFGFTKNQFDDHQILGKKPNQDKTVCSITSGVNIYFTVYPEYCR